MSELRDPRVLFAAERTLLAWTRTSIALIGFGFLIERFRLFERMAMQTGIDPARDRASLLIGLAFIALGAVFAATSTWQFVRVLRELQPAEFPRGYWVQQGTVLNLTLSFAGFALLILLAING